MDFLRHYVATCVSALENADLEALDRMVQILASVRERGGRLFLIGVGGGAGYAGHAVNDFRKICNIEAYAPTDNVSELTARINDEGWASVFRVWLETSRLNAKDALLVFSVGGGNVEHGLSVNIAEAVAFAKTRGAAVCGIVGRDGGATARHADACLKVRVTDPALTTAVTESMQAVFWHLLVSDPRLAANATRWESAVKR
jgi:D-sedoheptulose 7-phosphate isomerase